MQQPIDLCTPEISDDSESEFSPSTDTPTPTTWRAISDAGAVIRQQIQRRKSARLAALKAQKLLQVNTDVATPKNQVQAQKKRRAVDKNAQNAATIKRRKGIALQQPVETPNAVLRAKKCAKRVSKKFSATTGLQQPLSATTNATTTTISLPNASATTMGTPSSSATPATAMPAIPVVPVPVANAYYVANNAGAAFTRFHRVLSTLRERIALNPDNNSLDVSACLCKHCPYSTGLLSSQRFILMTRTFQVNQVLLHNPHLRDEFC